MKQKVTGIGGVFFRAKNPAKLSAWYREHLGLPIEAWGGCQFHWREHNNPGNTGSTVWNAFKADTDYFGSGKKGKAAQGSEPRQGHMINYRVADLKKMLAQLKKAGVWIDPKAPPQHSEYGKFAWIKDGEGNRVELWEPPAPARASPKPRKKRAK